MAEDAPHASAGEHAFVRALLRDAQALERLVESGLIETTPIRIGAEQEMFLVDAAGQPAPVGPELLAGVDEPLLTSELARFNLEANGSPRVFAGRCLSELEGELAALVEVARAAAAPLGADVLLTGILPTLRRHHLGASSMTPKARYAELTDAMRELRGGAFHIRIEGVDELDVSHDNVMLESCNTSFQIHLQVAPADFARTYNAAQVALAPVLAVSCNAPLFLGRRLWHETRIALFPDSTDSRSDTHRRRGFPSRVSFGRGWVGADGALEVFREQIARHRVLFREPDPEDDPIAVIDRGDAPHLKALCLHNGTVYPWNRACYGVGDGKPHLRIECRALPSGPTIADEVAGGALWLGLTVALRDRAEPVEQALSFADVEASFLAAAQHGLSAPISWLDGKAHLAAELVTNELIPLAREGLLGHGVDPDDVERYLGIVADRTRTGQTGARWMLDSLDDMGDRATRAVRERTLVRAMLANQATEAPGHAWPIATISEDDDWSGAFRRVEQFMTTDLFTVRPGDLIDLVASVMDWKHVRHVPVEDDAGRLVGIITHRALLRLLARGYGQKVKTPEKTPVTAAELMVASPVSVRPDTPTLEAIELMRRHQVSALPVVEDDDRLVGVVTEADLIAVSAKLLERFLADEAT